jgi:radical SAM superfamily enzyme YgiQ (UPF0313 family)
MKILVLDVYPDQPYRISKDTNGGYGTANDYGDTLIPRLLRYAAKISLDWPPLYAAYSAGALRAAGHEVDYSRKFDNKEYDLCLLTTSIVAHETEVLVAKQVSDAGIPVAAIGPFAGTMPDAYIEAGAFVVRGEPEMFFHEFRMTADDVAELGPFCGGEASVGLDELAYPAWDIIVKSHKTTNRLLGPGKKSLPMLATRGCPYSCANYCVYPLQQGNVVRSRSPEKIVEEMAYWQDTLGISNFVFRDPVFSINRKHTMAFCDELEESNRKFQFLIETHLKNIADDLGQRLRDVGLGTVYVGIESASAEVMGDVKRFTIELDEEKDRIRKLEKIGIKVKTMFIFGFPSDTLETCQETIQFAIDLCTAYTAFSVFTPYPGTPMFAKYSDKITTSKFEDFTQWRLVFEHDQLSPGDIRNLLNVGHSRYYSHPRWILNFLRNLFR